MERATVFEKVSYPDGANAGAVGGEFRQISELMYERFGVDLRQRKGRTGQRPGSARNCARAASRPSGRTSSTCWPIQAATLMVDMVDALTTNHTSFLREPAHFDFLVKTIVPAMASRERRWISGARPAPPEKSPIRSPARCSSAASPQLQLPHSGHRHFDARFEAKPKRPSTRPSGSRVPAAWRQSFLVEVHGPL